MTLSSIPPSDGITLPNEEIDLFSEDGSYSLIKLLANCQTTVEAIKRLSPDLLEKTERELLPRPEDVQRRLKISFWNEFRRAQRQKGPMVLSNVLFGVCSTFYWRHSVVKVPNVLAWLITPPTSDILVWQELLELGNKKLRRVLKLPLVEKRYWKDKSGELHVEKRTNVSLVKEIRAIVENMQDRLHGAVIQRQEIQAKSLNVNIGGSSKSASDEMEDIKKMLTRIEKVASSIPELPEAAIIDGTVIPEDPE